MTIQTATIATAPEQRRTRFLTAAAGAILALTAAAGIGAWQASRGGGSETATPPVVAVEQPIVARPVERAPTVYLVGTAAQAAAVQRGISEAAAIQAQLGESGTEDEVLLVASAEGEAALRLLTEQDAIRAELRLPPLHIVDLRTQSTASTPALDPAVFSDQEMYGRWLQALQAQAADPAAFSDQEMYSRWLQAQAAR